MARGEWLQVRVSGDEKQRIRDLAADAGLNESEYVRSRALGETPAVAAPDGPPESPRVPAVIDALRSIG